MLKIKVVVVPVQGNPKFQKIENDLSAMQNLVGGLIEFFHLKDNLYIICDEEAKGKDW